MSRRTVETDVETDIDTGVSLFTGAFGQRPSSLRHPSAGSRIVTFQTEMDP